MIEQIKPKSKNLVPDAIAGFTNAVVNIPDSIAAAVLAGVNPTYAFNAIMVGTPIGAFFTSSDFMSLGPTSAMMLTVGTALAAYSGETALTAMVKLTLLVGVFMFLLGVLKLGSVIRFVSKEVMSGFILAIALLATACGR